MIFKNIIISASVLSILAGPVLASDHLSDVDQLRYRQLQQEEDYFRSLELEQMRQAEALLTQEHPNLCNIPETVLMKYSELQHARELGVRQQQTQLPNIISSPRSEVKHENGEDAERSRQAVEYERICHENITRQARGLLDQANPDLSSVGESVMMRYFALLEEHERGVQDSSISAKSKKISKDVSKEGVVSNKKKMDKSISSDPSCQQIIGTQAFGAAYNFTSDDKVLEQAKKIHEMGSSIIKISVKDCKNNAVLDAILQMPFNTLFFWWRSDAKIWKDGLSESGRKKEYEETYNFAKHLLKSNAKVNRSFFLGHWEGDWYLLPDYNTQVSPDQTRINGMIEWLNIRQKAVEDARKEVGTQTLSKIYHYTEVNRVRDAMVHKKDRLVNKVLPNSNVDYVSYSSYDVQKESLKTIKDTLKYIEDHLPKKTDISGPRVFIGECGIPAKEVGFDPIKHEKVNRAIFIKFLESGVPYILYWQMYNNEIKDDVQNGFWLINDKNQKQPLYFTLEDLYKAQIKFKDIRKNSIEWLSK